MNYKTRYKDIAEILQLDKKVFVSDLSQRLGVSEVTIRNDLRQLEEMGILRRFHSGAVSIEDSMIDMPVRQKMDKNIDLKTEIARKALQIIESGTSVILDAGSTTHQIAKLLKNKHGLELKVVTNSLYIAEELVEVKGIELVLVGGNLRIESRAMVGPMALENLEKVHVDTAFIGAMGVSWSHGFTSSSILEAQVKKAVIKAAHKKIVVADHTKLNRFSFAPFASLGQVDMLITDGGVPREELKKLKKAGLKVL